MLLASLETVKQVSDVAGNAVTIAAAVVGGIWAYWAFLRERTRWPKAALELVVSHRELTGGQTLLHAKIKVHNNGRGLMKLTRIRVDVCQVKPLTAGDAKKFAAGNLRPEGKTGAEWEYLDGAEFLWGGEGQPASPELEPGENDEFDSDFFVPSTLETVFFYVYVTNVARKKNTLGWCVTSYYDLDGAAGEGSTVNVISGDSKVKEAA